MFSEFLPNPRCDKKEVSLEKRRGRRARAGGARVARARRVLVVALLSEADSRPGGAGVLASDARGARRRGAGTLLVAPASSPPFSLPLPQ